MNKTSQCITHDTEKIVQTTQGHACGLFVEYLNNLRLATLLVKLSDLESRKCKADQELTDLRASIAKLIESNRGGEKGMHGFIGERVQVSFSNSEALLNGSSPMYFLVDDNGMTDYICGDTLIQQKACLSDKSFGLAHVLLHSKKYPDFVEKGGVYQIPSDFYERYQYFLKMPEQIALKLRKEDLRAWRAVQKFHDSAPEIEVQPMTVTYAEIQAGAVTTTIDHESAKLNRQYDHLKNNARDSCKASVHECLKVVGASAILEGTVDATLSFTELASNKPVKSFDDDDWKKIALDGARGVLKGSIRGATVYTATNVANIPAPIATASVTAAFGIAHDITKLANDTISGKEFSEKAIEHCADAAVSVTCAKLGEKLIPIPFVGSLVGNAVGMLVFGIAKKFLKASLYH